MASTIQNQVATTKSEKKTMQTYIKSMEGEIKKALPSVITSERFTRMVLSAISVNPKLAQCTPSSFLGAMMSAAQLGLEPNTPLGQAYILPYQNKGVLEAQFQLGYKGYIQLAIRSGQYKKLNVLAIKEGELVRFDPLNEEIEVKLIEDEEARESAKTIGYYAMFEYVNGFKKALYWSRAKMEAHALKYSPGYANDQKKGTSWTFWSKDFDGMAYKTLLRQLISKWGVMSIEMMTAMDSDYAVINEDGTKKYVETDAENIIDAEFVEQTQTPTEPTETNNAQDALFG